MITSNVALKEWEAVVQALSTGKQLFLLRKGGIRDPKGAFTLQHREFFLYPTREHQGESGGEMIRPEFAPAAAGPGVRLSVYAGVGYVGQVRDPARLAALTQYHIWTPAFFEQRTKYRPQEPTLAVALRAYRLPKPVAIEEKPEYAGCKSWVTLTEPVPVEGAVPAVDDARFREAVEAIRSAAET